MHTSYYKRKGRKRFHRRKKTPYEPSKVRALLNQGKYVHEKRTIEVIYLEDDGAIVENLFFWGSPWQPEFCDWVRIFHSLLTDEFTRSLCTLT